MVTCHPASNCRARCPPTHRRCHISEDRQHTPGRVGPYKIEGSVPGYVVYLKVCIAVLPAALLVHFDQPHKHVLFTSSLIVGVVAAGLIPPRRGFLVLLATALILDLLYVRFLP